MEYEFAKLAVVQFELYTFPKNGQISATAHHLNAEDRGNIDIDNAHENYYHNGIKDFSIYALNREHWTQMSTKQGYFLVHFNVRDFVIRYQAGLYVCVKIS